MLFRETRLKGAFIIDIEPIVDERGFFARSWCQREFEKHGLCSDLVQCNISFNHQKGTLRGMHYQIPPHEESKLVRCTRGSIFDVIVDLRKDSRTYKKWCGVELSAENRRMIFIPGGFAHGFQTMEDNTEVFYQMSDSYHPQCARGVRWDDPAFGVDWPDDERIISIRDKSFPDYL